MAAKLEVPEADRTRLLPVGGGRGQDCMATATDRGREGNAAKAVPFITVTACEQRRRLF